VKCEVSSLGLELPGLGLVWKFEPGLGLGGYGLDYITDHYTVQQTNSEALLISALLE